MTNTISVQNLSKTFLVPHQQRSTIKENFIDFWRPRTFEKFSALTNVSFEVPQGQFLGITGPNGCGKSTLLKLLTGIYKPDSGQIQIKGRLAPLLELGIGFQQELSARDNIYINATLLGLKQSEIRHLLPKIVEFAEVGHFLDLKIKNYSSGMRQRLGFAIAAHLDADIYLCDEVLAVGDTAFQQKCLETFAQWKAQGKTIILVSHSSQQLTEFADRIIAINQGQIIADAEPISALEMYQSFFIQN